VTTEASVVDSLVRQHAIRQIALVVEDLDGAVRSWWDRLGVGPWTVYELAPPRLKDMFHRGQDVEFSLRHALGWKGEVQFELVQPLDGPSIFAEHLEEHGEGLHHLGVYVPDHASAVAQLEEQGFEAIQGARGFGETGDGAFAYFESDHPLAAIIEVIEAPSVRMQPAYVYPEQVDEG
jgi:catechol 2,3-dioxygenase-like lactoylglutathione lyase family enzyme